MNIQLACQTITWGEGQAERFDEIFPAIRDAGFDGVEIGFRHIKDVPPEKLKSQLERYGLVLAASHAGGNLEDTDQAGGERNILEEIIDYVIAAGASHLMYSGLNGESVEAVADDISMLGRAAERAARRGVQLLYHNHNWEFLTPGIMDALLASAPSSLGLCPDVGWLDRAGVDVLPFLQANATRIGAVHFKDFATPGDGTLSIETDTVPLGQGVAPLREVAAWLRGGAVSVDPLWVIAEQDGHSGPAEEAAAKNGRFLSETLKEVQK